MLKVSIHSFAELRLEYLVLDYNGTLACGGRLIDGVREELRALGDDLRIHVLTADTFGTVRQELGDLSCQVTVVPKGAEEVAKCNWIRQLGPGTVVAIGNGRNDRAMLREAVLGIAILQEEGLATGTLLAADLVCPGILPALRLLRDPRRLIASLRS